VLSHIHELFIYLSYSLDNSLQIGNNPSSSVSTSQPSCNYYCYVYYRQEKCGQQQQQHRMSPHNNNINNNNIDENSLPYDNYPNSNNTIIMHSPSPIGISSSSSSSSSSSVVSSTGSMSEIKYGDGNEDNLLRQSIIIVSKWIFPQLAFRLLHKIDETLAWNTDHTTCIVRAPGK
jgi:hypothetical protein